MEMAPRADTPRSQRHPSVVPKGMRCRLVAVAGWEDDTTAAATTAFGVPFPIYDRVLRIPLDRLAITTARLDGRGMLMNIVTHCTLASAMSPVLLSRRHRRWIADRTGTCDFLVVPQSLGGGGLRRRDARCRSVDGMALTGQGLSIPVLLRLRSLPASRALTDCLAFGTPPIAREAIRARILVESHHPRCQHRGKLWLDSTQSADCCWPVM